MTRVGEDVYYIRKSIEHFLTDFPSSSVPPRIGCFLCRNCPCRTFSVWSAQFTAKLQTGSRFHCSSASFKRILQSKWSGGSLSAAGLFFSVQSSVQYAAFRIFPGSAYFHSEPHGTIY